MSIMCLQTIKTRSDTSVLQSQSWSLLMNIVFVLEGGTEIVDFIIFMFLFIYLFIFCIKSVKNKTIFSIPYMQQAETEHTCSTCNTDPEA